MKPWYIESTEYGVSKGWKMAGRWRYRWQASIDLWLINIMRRLMCQPYVSCIICKEPTALVAKDKGEIMDKAKWKERCKKRFMSVVGVDEKFALELAETPAQEAEDNNELNEISPEDAADDEMSYWYEQL